MQTCRILTKLEIGIVALMYYIIGMSVIDTQIPTLGNDVHKYFQTPKPQ